MNTLFDIDKCVLLKCYQSQNYNFVKLQPSNM